MKVYLIITMMFLRHIVIAGSVSRDDYAYFSNTPRPPLDEQRKVAIEIITDAILSPSLDAVAIVQSPIDTYYRVSESATDVLGYMKALNFDFAFVAETLYADDAFPHRIALIQDRMFVDKDIGRNEVPRNYRDRLLHHDDSVWLVFLKADHVLNYQQVSRDSTVKKRLNRVMKPGVPKGEVLRDLGLDELLPPQGMFSLVEEFSSFLIDAPGPTLVPVVRERRRLLYPMLSVPDASKEYVFQYKFCDDLFQILRTLAKGDYVGTWKGMQLETEEGRAVAQRVLTRVADGASLAHLDVKRIRRKRVALPQDKVHTVLDIEGNVRDEEGSLIAGAFVQLIGSEANPLQQGGLAKTDNKGRFIMQLERAHSGDVRTFVWAEGYARTPGINVIDSVAQDGVELVIKRGVPVDFDIRVNFDHWKGLPIEGWGLAIMATGLREPVPVAIIVDNSQFPTQEQQLLFIDSDSASSINLIPGEYDLVWMDGDDRLVIDLGRSVLGKSRKQIVEVNLPDAEDVANQNSFQRIFGNRGDVRTRGSSEGAD